MKSNRSSRTVMHHLAHAFIALVLLAPTAQAAHIQGAVMDENEPISGAEIMLVNTSNNVIVTRSHSDNKGHYQLPAARGHYKIGAFAEAYSTVWIKAVVVEDSDLTLDIQMTPSAFADTPAPAASPDCD